jgi:hypothetical protein
VSPVITALLLVEDMRREGLLRKSEGQRDAATGASRRYWQAYVAEDLAALGAWRALWPVLVCG